MVTLRGFVTGMMPTMVGITAGFDRAVSPKRAQSTMFPNRIAETVAETLTRRLMSVVSRATELIVIGVPLEGHTSVVVVGLAFVA